MPEPTEPGAASALSPPASTSATPSATTPAPAPVSTPPSTPAATPAPGWPLRTGQCSGQAECRDAIVHSLVALAPEAGPLRHLRSVWLADPDFDAWPLDDAAVLQALSAWLRQPGRQLQLAADGFEALARRHPRFARWRREFGHAIACWQPEEGRLPAELCGLFARPLWLQRQPTRLWQLLVRDDPQQADRIEHQLAAFLQRCVPAWPVTTLGL